MNTRRIISLTIACMMALSLSPGIAIAQDAEEEAPSLYERLGGVYAIATVVDDLIERLLVNDVLNANPVVDESRNRVPKAGIKFHLTAMVCWASGGPEQYTGRSMLEIHKNMNITEAEWNAMLADFKASLDKFEVPETEQGELFAIIGTTKGDIVKSE